MVEASLELNRADIGFSAAHFSIHQQRSERLHGHNYRVAVSVHGPLDSEGTVVDFATLKQALRELCGELHERTLLPTRSPSVTVQATAEGIQVAHEQRRFVFPADDCVLLPIVNTTCECLAAHLLAALRQRLGPTGYRVRLLIEETPGQGAAVTEQAP